MSHAKPAAGDRPGGIRPALTLHPRVPASFAKRGGAAISELAAQLPDPSELDAGSWIAVGRGITADRSWLRLGRSAGSGVALALRCSALLARGYVDICASEDVAYGRTPAQPCEPIARSFS
jgi:hypothetical protein